MAGLSDLGSSTSMPQTQETSRLAPGLPRAVVELPMSEPDPAVASVEPRGPRGAGRHAGGARRRARGRRGSARARDPRGLARRDGGAGQWARRARRVC